MVASKSENQQSDVGIPVIALALRLTVELFRVLSQDQNKLTCVTLIDYVN